MLHGGDGSDPPKPGGDAADTDAELADDHAAKGDAAKAHQLYDEARHHEREAHAREQEAHELWKQREHEIEHAHHEQSAAARLRREAATLDHEAHVLQRAEAERGREPPKLGSRLPLGIPIAVVIVLLLLIGAGAVVLTQQRGGVTSVLPAAPTATTAPAVATATALPTATPLPPPKLSVSPTQATAFCANGGYPTALTVSNAGGQTLHWTVTGPTGVTITPASGSLTPSASQSVQLSGTYPGHASFTLAFAGDGGNQTVTITCR